ncbi:MAG: hypothetical protein JXB05_13420 [Myxococcaceae bacterium]|nr:hypothetical protein [Myxococcaceae bacterium]
MTDGAEPSGGGLFSRDLAPPPRGPWRRRAVILAAFGAVMLAMWLWVNSSGEGAIRAMSPAQQEAFYGEAWADQRAKCLGDAGPREPESQCRKRAEFLLRFPQCDEACRAELAPFLQGTAP